MLLAALLVGFTPAGETIAIEKAKVGVGSGAQEGVVVLLRDGRIAAIGRDVAIPAGSERIDGSGLTLIPGFIDAFSDFGLQKGDEKVLPTASNDGVAQDYGVAAYAETAEANRRGLRPELRARDLLAAPDKEAGEKLRNAGFTSVLAAPAEGLAAGQACLIEIVELPPRDAVVAEPGLLVLKFRGGGGGGGGPGRGRRDEGDYGYPSTLMGSLAHLRQAFLDAQRLRSWRDAWRRSPAKVERPPSDSCLDALLLALDGELRVAFLVDREGDVLRALAFAEEFRLKPVIVGGKEAWKCAAKLAAARVPVIASLNFPDAPERKNAKLKKKDEKPKDPPAEPPKPDAAQPAAPEAAAAPAEPVAPTPAPPAPAAPASPPEEWEVTDVVLAEPLELFEERRKNWEDEVKNVERLLATGVEVALTTRGSSGTSDFFGDLRVAIEHGLDANGAVACLTSTPAALFDVGEELGSLKVGAAADLTLVEGDLASKERAVRHAFVAGRHFLGPKKKPPEAKEGKDGKEGADAKKDAPGEGAAALDLTGTWALTSKGPGGYKATLTLKQEGGKLSGKLESEMGSADVSSGTLDGSQFTITVSMQFQNQKFEFTLKGSATKDALEGTLDTPFGEPSDFTATRGPGRAADGARAEDRR